MSTVGMDWFERLTGFREASYADTRSKLRIEGQRLRSLVNNKSYEVGKLELASLKELRDRAGVKQQSGRTKFGLVVGDVREMHQGNADALFQVASQFNLLEMTGPSVTPEDGVSRYAYDRTQGPACAIAAGAATIYRNYFALVDGAEGQTATRQLDGLAEIGLTLEKRLERPVSTLWTMQNGYALCSEDGLRAITRHLEDCSAEEVDELRSRLRIGLHWDVEVTDSSSMVRVSQAFCSGLPVSCGRAPAPLWRSFALLVLEAAYEATLISALLNAQRGRSNVVFLTQLGGGAFGNDASWIEAAMRRALRSAAEWGLIVKLVSFSEPPTWLRNLVQELGRNPGT
jgi:hypothetical protein